MNEDKQINPQPPRKRFSTLLLAILAIFVIVIAWHIFLPLLGIGVVLTLGLMSVIVVSVILVALGVLLLYLLPALFIGLIALIVLGWTVFAIMLFPILFPLLAPLVIILLIVAYFVGRGRRRS